MRNRASRRGAGCSPRSRDEMSYSRPVKDSSSQPRGRPSSHPASADVLPAAQPELTTARCRNRHRARQDREAVLPREKCESRNETSLRGPRSKNGPRPAETLTIHDRIQPQPSRLRCLKYLSWMPTAPEKWPSRSLVSNVPLFATAQLPPAPCSPKSVDNRPQFG